MSVAIVRVNVDRRLRLVKRREAMIPTEGEFTPDYSICKNHVKSGMQWALCSSNNRYPLNGSLSLPVDSPVSRARRTCLMIIRYVICIYLNFLFNPADQFLEGKILKRELNCCCYLWHESQLDLMDIYLC